MTETARADLLLDRDEQLRRTRHSCAHVLAQAVVERFEPDGDVQIGIGPPTSDGFYYDFLLPRAIGQDDLEWLERRMKEVLATGLEFEREEISPQRARELFARQRFKTEIIEGVLAGNVDEHGNPVEHQVPLSIYRHGDFIDLCAGPHVRSMTEIDPDAVKLLGTAGAYWRGSEKQPMLQRIYGTAWENEQQLDQFLELREQAAQRDHRRLGRELELFFIEPTAPGMPYWLPNGTRLLNKLFDFWREVHDAEGYEEVVTPLINEKSLWTTSGHWDHYQDNMFVIPVDENRTYGVKPMNCPNAMVIYRSKTRSYRDLPLRFSDGDVLHRNERSGTLHGLLRVQSFRQDDAHIFLQPSQLSAEFERLFDLTDRFYSTFGLRYRIRLGTRPESFIGDVETWNDAEDTLRRILTERAGSTGFEELEGDGAFYGPKIDILVTDALGREWQTGTMQLDFQLPRRFNCVYAAEDGSRNHPVVVHRAIYGSFERFLGILIEDTDGAFPPWLAPEPVWIVPVDRDSEGHVAELRGELRGRRINAVALDSATKLGAHVQNAHQMRIPYVVVVGRRERENDTVSVRLRGSRSTVGMDRSHFVERLTGVIARREREVGTLLEE